MAFLKKIWLSITQPKAYLAMATEGLKRTFMYFILLLIFTFAVMGYALYKSDLKPSLEQVMQKVESIPDFTIRGGKLKFSGRMPFNIDIGEYHVTIDTSGDTDLSQWKKKYQQGVLVQEERVLVINRLQKQEYLLSRFAGKGEEFTNQDFLVMAHVLIPLMILIVAIIFLIVYICTKLFSALILSFLGRIISTAFGLSLPSGHAFSFAVFALTCPILFSTIMQAFGVNHLVFVVLYWGMALTSLVIALENVQNKQHRGDDLTV